MCLLVAQNPHIPHPLNGDVVEIEATIRLRIELVPTCGNGSIHLNVLSVVAGIEQQHAHIVEHDGLEEGKVGIRLHRFLVDVIELHVVLVGRYHLGTTVVDLLLAQVRALLDGVQLVLQFILHDGKLLDFGAVVGAFHLVVGRHRGVGSLEADNLGGINRKVDNLPGYAQTVELGRLPYFPREVECSIGVELYRVFNDGAVKTHVLEIEYRVLGLSDSAVHLEFLVVTRDDSQCSEHGEQRCTGLEYSHVSLVFLVFIDCKSNRIVPKHKNIGLLFVVTR